jgi:drug/metabolite transporter (DMT)-like permease
MSPKSLFQFATVVLIWGTTWIVIKSQLGLVDPSWSVTYRFAIGGLALLAWCAVRGEPLRFPRQSLGFLLLFATLQFVMNFNFVYRAELHIPSGFLAIAFALLMIPNALLARLFLNRRITPRFVCGAALGVAGVGLLFAQQLAMPASREATILGLSLTAAGVLSASCANVMQATPAAQRYPALPGLAWAMLLGAGLNALLAWGITGAPQWDPRPVYLAGVLYLGILASALAFALYFDLLRAIGPAEAAWTGVPIPILAMTISTLAEGYRWTPMAVAGGMIALVGLVVALRQPAPRPAQA